METQLRNAAGSATGAGAGAQRPGTGKDTSATEALSPEQAGESARLHSLHSLDILDTASEKQYDDLIRLASFICDTPIAMISLVDSDRQWFKAKIGVDFTETSRSESICSHAIKQNDLFIVEDTTLDARFQQMPLVKSGAIRFYAGAPICSPEGQNVGSFCVIDDKPRTLTAAQKDALALSGQQASAYLLIKRQVQQLLHGEQEYRRVEQQLREKQELLEEANRKLQNLASTDPLTGLTNRRALETRMAAHRTATEEREATLSVLMMDVDHFKVINDTRSHEAGDEVLCQVASLLRGGARESDTLSRYGGEEFVLLMPGIPHELALARAEKLRKAVADGSPVTISIGVASMQSRADGLSVAELLANADRALYAAKREGRNCVCSAEALRPKLEVALEALAS